MDPCGGVGLGIECSSSGLASLDLGSCGGEGLSEMTLCLFEGGARVADGDGHEYHLPPQRLEGVDEWGVLGGLLLKTLVASEVLVESELKDDQDAQLAVEGVRVRRRDVRYSSRVNEVGGGAVSLPE